MVDIVHEIGYSDDVKQEWRSFPLDAAAPRQRRHPHRRAGAAAVPRGARRASTPSSWARRWSAARPTPSSPCPTRTARRSAPSSSASTSRATSTPPSAACCSRWPASAPGPCAGPGCSRPPAPPWRPSRRPGSAAEKAQERLAFMAEASSTLASFLDYELTLSQVVDLAVPRLADWCAVHLVRDDGRIRPLAVAHVDPERVALVRELHGALPARPRRRGRDRRPSSAPAGPRCSPTSPRSWWRPPSPIPSSAT